MSSVVKKIIFFLIFNNLLILNIWAGNEDLIFDQNPSSHLVELRKSIPIPHLSIESDIKKYLNKYTPLLNYMNRWDELISQYENITLIGGGGSSVVYKAHLKKDRLEVGLKKGDAIALRVSAISSESRLPSYIMSFYNTIIPLINLLELGTDFGKKITDYYPKIYGYYLGPSMSQSIISNPQAERSWIDNEKIVYGWIEMELVDHDFTKEFPNGESIPVSIEFEDCLGSWAGGAISRVLIGDYKHRNLGISTVPYYRAYEIDDTTYLIPPGKMPKRLDIDASNTKNFIGIENQNWGTHFDCNLSNVNEFKIPKGFSLSHIPSHQIRNYKIPKKYLKTSNM